MIQFDPRKLLIVPIDRVRPNPWNPKNKSTPEYEKIRRGIELKGLRLPIIVRENEDEVFEIVDGEQRWTACQELEYKKVMIYNEGPLSDKEAKELTLWYQQQVPFDEIALAGMLKNLAEQFADLEIPFSEAELEKYQELASFDWDRFDTQEAVDTEAATKPEVMMFKVTPEQHDIITRAIERVREENPDCSDGRALELVCADFLGGV